MEGRMLGKRDWMLLALLLCLSAAMHGWILAHTEVAARDSIGYIRYAWQLDHKPWRDVLSNSEQHPGFPVLILGMSKVVSQVVVRPEPILMQLSAQLVSAAAAILLVIPMFLLGRALFDARVGFWSSLLLQLLPISSRILADGLSEATFLLFAVTAMLCGFRALRSGSVCSFVTCGLFAGLAYLTRPEGAVIAAATGLVLLALQARPAWRRAWGSVAVSAIGLTAAALAVGGPFIWATGRITVKPSANNVLEAASNAPSPATGPSGLVAGSPLYAAWDSTAGPGPARGLWSVKAVTMELVKGFYYVGWIPALLGLWWFRDRAAQQPGAWMLGVVCAVILFFLWRVAKVMGYISDRHMMLMILCGSYWAVAAVLDLPRRLGGLTGRLRILGHRLAPLVLLLVVTGVGGAKSLEPLHANRGGFREAGLWLAEHATPWDELKDPYCWAHYYAGRVFIEDRDTHAPDGHLPVWYVILEEGKSQHERLTGVAEAVRLKDYGKPVWHWEGRRGKDHAVVDIYEVPAVVPFLFHIAPGVDR